MPNPTLSDNLKKLMSDRHMRTAELSRMAGLPQPTVHRLVVGSSPHPHPSTLKPLAEFFNLTVEQLKGFDPLPGKDRIQTDSSDWQQLCLMDLSDNHELTYIDLATDKVAFAIVVNDSSMEPCFPPGKLVFINTASQLKDRDYIIVHLHDRDTAIFRQLLIDANQRHIKSISPEFAEFPVQVLGDNDVIVGAVMQTKSDIND